MDCPRCGGKNYRKNGVIKGKQRYLCRKCEYHYTVRQRTKTFDANIRNQALAMYLEGISIRGIGRVLKVSHVLVYNWIKEFGMQAKTRAESLRSIFIDTVEMDEMCSYIGSKKNRCWIWIAVDRKEKKFLGAVCGSRGKKTGEKLWNNIKGQVKNKVMTDYYSVYQSFIPANLHVQSKAQTYTVEGYNSLFRHFLARMRRKTKCYSKSLLMLEYSILLLMEQRNSLKNSQLMIQHG